MATSRNYFLATIFLAGFTALGAAPQPDARGCRVTDGDESFALSVTSDAALSDIRFGASVGSPMVPDGEADILLVMDPSQVANTRHRLAPKGLLLESTCLDGVKYGSPKSATVAMLGVLSAHLDIPVENWHAAIAANLPEKLREMNVAAFDIGRAHAEGKQ